MRNLNPAMQTKISGEDMPPTPKDEWVDLNGMSFHYRDWGGSGQPIVLLHGLASNCHIWDVVAPILSENNAVIAWTNEATAKAQNPIAATTSPRSATT